VVGVGSEGVHAPAVSANVNPYEFEPATIVQLAEPVAGLYAPETVTP